MVKIMFVSVRSILIVAALIMAGIFASTGSLSLADAGWAVFDGTVIAGIIGGATVVMKPMAALREKNRLKRAAATKQMDYRNHGMHEVVDSEGNFLGYS
ncbi:MAG: hypothetical protein H6797_03600 [Candidatus Nomurabacteria bacterium]|nr:MAG: hypothetical protein H6797_03600 [Candidatus Nomurabacteria bacterium]